MVLTPEEDAEEIRLFKEHSDKPPRKLKGLMPSVKAWTYTDKLEFYTTTTGKITVLPSNVRTEELLGLKQIDYYTLTPDHDSFTISKLELPNTNKETIQYLYQQFHRLDAKYNQRNYTQLQEQTGQPFLKKWEAEQKETIKKEKQEAKVITLTGLQIDNFLGNVKQFHTLQPFFYDKNLIYWFWNKQQSKWEMVDETDIMNSLEKHLQLYGQTINQKIKNQYLEAFKRIGRNKTPKPAKKHWVQFKNKAYCLHCGKTYEVTPDYFFTNPLPHQLSNNNETPTMDKLFKEWVGQENVETLYQLISYCCLTDYPIHLIFCLVGSGRNGKTTFQKLLTKFIGLENTCSTELDALLGSRFESFKLYRKIVCTMGETNFGVMKKTSLIKKLTGQDLIGFEIKNKGLFDDVNYAKIIINSNSLPTSQDTSEGFYRRWMIIDFPNEFPEGKSILETIPEQEYNALSRKVTEILPGILKDGFIKGQGSIEQRRVKYIMASNPLPFFIEACCELGDDFYASYNEMYTAYVHVLRLNKRRKVSQKEFKTGLEDEGLFPEKTSKTVGLGEDGYNMYKIIFWVEGIRLKPDWKDFAYFAYLTSFSIPSPARESELKFNGNGQNKQNKPAKPPEKVRITINEGFLDEKLVETGLPTFSSFHLSSRPLTGSNGTNLHCVNCGLRTTYYTHMITGSSYCQLCAGDVEKNKEVAK